jgi:hypothetical protein
VNLTCSTGDQLAVAQVLEDGATEFADANIILTLH